MKKTLATTCFAIGAMLAPVAAFAADSDTDRSKPEQFVKDSVITTKIKTKLRGQALLRTGEGWWAVKGSNLRPTD
jgi:hyperosmotically inducible periplasmic protein